MADFIIFPPLFIIFFFFYFPLLPPSTCSISTNQTDQLSLLAIKSSLQDPQQSLNSWNQTHHVCSWDGIQCSRRHPGRVVAINLTSKGLIGVLSPLIGNLSFLTSIILQNNTFQGHIPSQLTLLRRLEVIEFSNNSFIGTIPSNLSQCFNLFQISFTNNLLSGTIPYDLGFLTKLDSLSLSRNMLSGPIPASIGNITTLTTLSLGTSSYTGEIPGSFGQLRLLEFLQLSQNKLTGIIPNGLFNLSNMIYLDVSINQLHGVIPSNIGVTLPNLAVLLLENNQFSGPIPSSISNATFLEWIILSSNNFSGPMPSVERLTILQDFYLHSNLVEGDIGVMISSMTNSTALQHFDASENLLRGSLPPSIANLSVDLNMLYLYKNQISGSIPLGIGNLISLEVFDLSHNLLDGSLPVTMSKLFNLQTILLGRNKFSGKLPSMFGNITFLSRFRVDGNDISGNVPSNLGNCTHLLELDLSDNSFTGLIPREIMRLSSIAIALNLSHNEFVGSIPDEVGLLTNLVAIDLSSNRLSGIVPSSLSKCLSLEYLYLDQNLLEGEVPAGIMALMGLQDLDLSRNNLSGSIPTFLGSLKLEKLNLSFNRLHGEVPTEGVFKNITSISLDGNQELCGGVADLRFPPCSGAESSKRKLSTLMKILIPVLVIGGISIMVLVYLKCKRTKNRTSLHVSSNDSIGLQFMRLSYADLLKATSGFSEGNLLGFGRFGSVYKGLLDGENTFVAVKVLDLAVKGASKTFMAECKALGGIKHRNLVKLLTVCDSVDYEGRNFKALVYEFKVNGSLEKWLYNNEIEQEKNGKNGEEIRRLSIIQRLNIAIDIAKGIEYLHFGSGSTIVHGDLKPSNILLDDEMVACVGDFGLAKIVSEIAPSHESTNSIGIKGTFGYVPPEYGTFGSMSTQGDVYSYGIILLEMFTNKSPTGDLFGDRLNLHDYVRSALTNRIREVVDPLFEIEPLKKGMKIEYLGRVLSVGVSCSMDIPKDRMKISDVINELSNIQKLF